MMSAWLSSHGDWLFASVFIALITSTTIGFRSGSKGGAILTSNASAAVMSIVIYPFLQRWGYADEFSLLLGLVCGACGYAMFGVLIALSDTIDRRRSKIADSVLDRVAPETKL